MGRKQLPKGIKDQCRANYGYRCAVCGCELKPHEHHIDHIVPLADGGSDNVENLQPLCLRCHGEKHGNADLYVLSRKSMLKNGNYGGRKPMHITEDMEKVFDDYLHCRIGTKRAKELLGCSESKQKMSQMAAYKSYRKGIGIARSANFVDTELDHFQHYGESQRARTGYIEFQDGRQESFGLEDSEEFREMMNDEPEGNKEMDITITDLNGKVDVLLSDTKNIRSVLARHDRQIKELEDRNHDVSEEAINAISERVTDRLTARLKELLSECNNQLSEIEYLADRARSTGRRVQNKSMISIGSVILEELRELREN